MDISIRSSANTDEIPSLGWSSIDDSMNSFLVSTGLSSVVEGKGYHIADHEHFRFSLLKCRLETVDNGVALEPLVRKKE